VTVEAYPELKSNQLFASLQVDLAGTENRISTERMRYNDTVKNFNLVVRRFPASLFAGMFGFTVKTPFDAVEGADKAPTVDFAK
jgi:LemA protein